MPTARDTAVDPADGSPEAQQAEALLKTGALQKAIFNSANFSSIATDANGVIQIFNVGAERMLGYTAAEVVNTMTATGLHDTQGIIARATALSIEFGTPIAPGFDRSGHQPRLERSQSHQLRADRAGAGTARKQWCRTTRRPSTTAAGICRACSPPHAT
jgi:PAS domain-containing protein